VPNSSLLLIKPSPEDEAQSYLFIPAEDPMETMWSPPPPSLELAREGHDATIIKYTADFISTTSRILLEHPDALIHTLPMNSKLFPSASPEFVRVFADKATSGYLLAALHLARLIKTPCEIDLIRKANAISSRAHEVIMRLLARGSYTKPVNAGAVLMPDQWRIEREAEAEAIFVATCRREGCVVRAHRSRVNLVIQSPAPSVPPYRRFSTESIYLALLL
jgi:Xaa-Pro dipeptidase